MNVLLFYFPKISKLGRVISIINRLVTECDDSQKVSFKMDTKNNVCCMDILEIFVFPLFLLSLNEKRIGETHLVDIWNKTKNIL